MNYYNENYLTIDESLEVNSLPLGVLPPELLNLVDIETVSDLPPKRWIQLKFLPHYKLDHLTNMILSVNTFPANNKRLRKRTNITLDTNRGYESLTTGIGEVFLATDSVFDNTGPPISQLRA